MSLKNIFFYIPAILTGIFLYIGSSTPTQLDIGALLTSAFEKQKVFFSSVSAKEDAQENELKYERIEKVSVVSDKKSFKKEAFLDIDIHGKAYVVYDIVDQNIIAEKNSKVIMPIASITKIMTALTARTHYSPDRSITIHSSSIDGAFDFGLKKGQVFSLNELLKYMLVSSSNDGARAIADGLSGRKKFVEQMNNDAKKFGLTLSFTDPAGLDESGYSGGEGSAFDVAQLVQIVRRELPELFDITTKKKVEVVSSTGMITGILNTNQDVDMLSGIEVSKTGFTNSAGGNLVVVVDILVGHPVVIVVLGSTKEKRFTDVEKLYKALQKSLR